MRGVVMYKAGDVRVQEREVFDLSQPIEQAQALQLMPGDPGLSICTYTVEEDSESAEKFVLLASWAATQQFGYGAIDRDADSPTHRE